MFVFDIFKDDGGRLRIVGAIMVLGMVVLLGGLWFVQVVFWNRFQSDLDKQSFRHVRTPAIRGAILDRNGVVLAGEEPRHTAVLYLEDLQGQFRDTSDRMRKAFMKMHPEMTNSKGKLSMPKKIREQIQTIADCAVVSNYVYRISASLGEPRLLNASVFRRHYESYPYVPFPIVPDLKPAQVAVLAEQWTGQPAIDVETDPVRHYPKDRLTGNPLAANLIGYVLRRDPEEDSRYSFDMPDFEGKSGIEIAYDDLLCGQPGDKSVLINNMNYRQREEIDTPNLPGKDIYLTIDANIQRVAEAALARAPRIRDSNGIVRGAVIVMDPRNGDILAIASAPSFDPNLYVKEHRTAAESAALADPKFKPQFNRAMSGFYPPGSIFKIITGFACLESGLDPTAIYNSPGEWRPPNERGGHVIKDEASAGPYDFVRAFYRSSNTYFIAEGIDHIRKILEVAKRFHLGEKTAVSKTQEASGYIPGPEKVGPNLGMSPADICIGQEITTTPLQVAGMISVIANGGTLYWPRVVSLSRSPDTGETEQIFAKGRVRDHIQINPQHLKLIRGAMLEDTEHQNLDGMGAGTAYPAFHDKDKHLSTIGNFHVAAKTGTAEVKSPGSAFKRVTWVASYAPFEDPRYVVVVMVEDGDFGGTTCAPVAAQIYDTIYRLERDSKLRSRSFAKN